MATTAHLQEQEAMAVLIVLIVTMETITLLLVATVTIHPMVAMALTLSGVGVGDMGDMGDIVEAMGHLVVVVDTMVEGMGAMVGATAAVGGMGALVEEGIGVISGVSDTQLRMHTLMFVVLM